MRNDIEQTLQALVYTVALWTLYVLLLSLSAPMWMLLVAIGLALLASFCLLTFGGFLAYFLWSVWAIRRATPLVSGEETFVEHYNRMVHDKQKKEA